MNDNPTQRVVIAGIDGSDPVLAAVDLAAAEARRRRLPLRLLATAPRADAAAPTDLTAVLRRVSTTWPDLPTSGHTVTGALTEEVIDASRGAGLVVIGRPDRRAHHPLGGDEVRIAAHSQCPTVVVPAGAPVIPDAPVLLGVGIVPDDEPAIGFAFETASLWRVPLLAVHVWSGIPSAAVGKVSPFAYDLHRAQAAADAMLADQLAGWAEKFPDVRVDRMPLYDVNPAQTLLDASAMAGLVVVGAHRRDLGGSQLLGTVSRTLVASASRPVAVIHPAYHP